MNAVPQAMGATTVVAVVERATTIRVFVTATSVSIDARTGLRPHVAGAIRPLDSELRAVRPSSTEIHTPVRAEVSR